MATAWVIGAGGMLGSALEKSLSQRGDTLYRPPQPLRWREPTQLRQQLRSAVDGLRASLTDGMDWEIYWAAGVGAMGSSLEELQAETDTLAWLLEQLEKQLAGLSGRLGFASSAGALYSNCQDFEISEASTVTLMTDYARAKAMQESLLKQFAERNSIFGVLAARFSTLYGPGQAHGKRQGLLSHIARSALRNQPVEIFVPLDTARDYLFVDDAAERLISALRATVPAREVDMRIIATERSVTISEILATFSRLLKRPVRVVSSRNRLSALYARRISYRSVHPLPTPIRRCRHTLLEGAAALLAAERAAYINGQPRNVP